VQTGVLIPSCDRQQVTIGMTRVEGLVTIEVLDTGRQNRKSYAIAIRTWKLNRLTVSHRAFCHRDVFSIGRV